MGGDPASAPGAHGTVSGAHTRGNLLIALLGMGMGGQYDAGSHGQRLRCGVGSDELLKVLGFFSGQCNGICGFGTSHGLSPPLSTFLPFYLLSVTLSNSENTCDSLYLAKIAVLMREEIIIILSSPRTKQEEQLLAIYFCQ